MKKTILIVLALMILLVTACQTDDLEMIEPAVEEMIEITEAVQEDETVEETKTIPEGIEDVTILLMGSMTKDFSAEGSAYCLTHILITLDTQNQSIKFTTFPYNLAVNAGEDNKTMQLQQICANGGEDYAVKVLEENFGIDIDYWVVMNMNAVIDIVDAVEGIEIDIKDLSINEAAMHLVEMLNLAWEEVINTGRQKLSGVQVAGYFVDTWTETDDWMAEEETYFREHHSNIIKGLIESAQLLGLNSDDFISIAHSASANYSTNIPDDLWQTIADTALYCIENQAEFLHVPKDIAAVETDEGWQSIGYADEDVTLVKEFVGE